MAIENPNVADRHDQTAYMGPIGNGTFLTGPVFIDIDSLPVADPNVKGQLWNNAGVLTVSEGA